MFFANGIVTVRYMNTTAYGDVAYPCYTRVRMSAGVMNVIFTRALDEDKSTFDNALFASVRRKTATLPYTESVDEAKREGLQVCSETPLLDSMYRRLTSHAFGRLVV